MASASLAETAGQRLTVLYGSQTGNAQRIARTLAERAEAAGLAVRLLRADAYPLRELTDERLLYVVLSTQGARKSVVLGKECVSTCRSRREPYLEKKKNQ